MQEQIPITQEQWGRIYRLLHDQLGFICFNGSCFLTESSRVETMNAKIPDAVLRYCHMQERYDLIAEAMQLFHEIGVDTQEDELL